MIRIPLFWKTSPNQPPCPYTRISASPAITGETTNGRSISASSTDLPRALLRARTIAAPTPKIVLSGTAMTASITVNQNALTAAGVVMYDQAVPIPCSNVRQNTRPTGSRSSSPRYASATNRSDRVERRLTIHSGSHPSQAEQHQQGDQHEHNRQRRRRLLGAALDVGVDHDRGDLHLARDQRE